MKLLLFLEKIIVENMSKDQDDGLDTITETDNEDIVDDEVSEGATGLITDDTATEDETVDHTQGSDAEGKFFYILLNVLLK